MKVWVDCGGTRGPSGVSATAGPKGGKTKQWLEPAGWRQGGSPGDQSSFKRGTQPAQQNLTGKSQRVDILTSLPSLLPVSCWTPIGQTQLGILGQGRSRDRGQSPEERTGRGDAG